MGQLTKNNNKVLNIIFQYFDDETSQVVMDHLGLRIQNVSTSEEIVKSVESVLHQQVEDNGKGLNLRYEIENSKKNEHNLLCGMCIYCLNSIAQ